MVRDLSAIHFPAFHSNLFFCCLRSLEGNKRKGFPLQSGLKSYRIELLLQFSKKQLNKFVHLNIKTIGHERQFK